MDTEITRKAKKRRSLNYAQTCNFRNYDYKATFSNQDNANSTRCSLPPLTKSNSGSGSQSSNFMCSHEKVQLVLNMSSDEMSSTFETKRATASENKLRLGLDKNNAIDSNTFQNPRNPQENTIADELLRMDDSLLEKIDLSFTEASMIKNGNCLQMASNQNLLGVSKLDDVLEPVCKQDEGWKNSPDIFNSNLEDNEEIIDPEDQAWDMSIRVSEEKEKSLCEDNKTCHDTPISPGLSKVVLSTWIDSVVSPPKTNDNLSFEELLKKTLSNNAHKKVILRSSPQSLFSSPGNKILSLHTDLFFGLPCTVKRLIKRFKGITKLYDWQEECLQLPAIETRKNLVYALPTSGGKTLVAEILVLKEILCREKNVLFVLPYVSIAQEKVRAFSPFAVELGFLVEEYAGSKGSYPPQKRRRKRSVYVATIEKALGLVHSLIECQRIQELGLIVVDELHLIGEPKRGAHLESMLTKLMFIKGDVQIIGMSATIGNLSDIATFLNADVYTQDFRPVELTEYVKVEDELFRVDYSIQDEVPLVFHSKLSFECSQEQKQKDPDQIGALVQEVCPEHSCLVFCPSKKNCENVTLLICNAFKRNIVEHKSEEKKALFRALMSEGNGIVCPTLKKTLPFGVAYHHSGLTTAERSLLEEAFLAKTICCICCTSTLAAGVNLPARRVILRSPYIGIELLSLSKYKQMVGRAGRTGLGDVGESFLLCQTRDATKVGELLSSAMDLCNSQLQGNGLANLIIGAVDLGLTQTQESLEALVSCSLLSTQAARWGIQLGVELNTTLEKLVQAGAIIRDGSNLTLSNIGKAAVKANVDMETAQQLYRDLQVAQDSLVLLSHLHLLYLCTPYTVMDQIRFQQQPFCSSFMELEPKEIQTAKVLGIGDQCVAQLMSGKSIKGNLSHVVHRFYLSLILFDLWNQNSIWKVSTKYLLPRGLVHNFLISSSAFASSIVRFCEVLEDLWCFKLLVSDMSTRLTHCCTLELLPLMELPAVKIGRAKQLYNAGFKSLSILAKTEPKALVQAVDHMPRRIAHQIVAAAKLMLLAKAESLQEEAEDVLEGLKECSI